MAKKKRSGASSKATGEATSARPELQTNDSLIADIEAAKAAGQATDPFADDADEAQDGLDIADDLLAALDAQDEAKMARGGGGKTKGKGKDSNANEGLAVPSTSASGRRRSVGEMIADKGGRLLGRSPNKESPVAVVSSHNASESSALSTSPGRNSGGESDGGGGGGGSAKSKSSSHRMGSIRRIFGKGGDKATPDEEAVDEEGEEDEEDGAEASGAVGAATTSGGGLGMGMGRGGGKKKVSRQQQRKERKAAEIAAIKAQAEAELKANGGKPDEAERERVGIQELCQALKVEMIEINPDGHCLYAAVADQLNTLGKVPGHVTYQDTRKATASHMREHADEFIPFISDSDESMAGIANNEAGKDGDEVRESQHKHYLSYCDAVESTGVWGGQPEILALSRAYQTPIHVVQVGSPVLKVGEGEQTGEPVMISYHRRMYGLGEHYNSLRKKAKA